MKIDRKTALYLLVLYVLVGVVSGAYLLAGGARPIIAFLASWTPNISAFIVIGIILKEKNGIKNLLRRWIQWRVPPVSYVLALIYLLIIGLSILIYIAIGGEMKNAETFRIKSILVITPLLLITGATGEELGWRGIMLSALQKNNSSLVSSLIISFFWIIFHIPLWLRPELGYSEVPFAAFSLSTVGLSITMSYLVNRSGGSLLVASIAHFAANFGLAFVPALGIDPGRLFYIYAIGNLLYALIVIVFSGKQLGKKSNEQNT